MSRPRALLRRGMLTVGVVFTLTGLALAADTRGTLQAVHPVAGQVVLDNGSMLAVNEDTEIWVGDRQGSLADLQPGERITATYRSEEDQNVASRIEVEPDGASRLTTDPSRRPPEPPR